jgi:hypothetical protein
MYSNATIRFEPFDFELEAIVFMDLSVQAVLECPGSIMIALFPGLNPL